MERIKNRLPGSHIPPHAADKRARSLSAFFLSVLVLFALLVSLAGCGKGKETAAVGEESHTAAADKNQSSVSSAADSSPETEKSGDPSLLEVVFFDVGKGDCILLSASGQHILLDGGYEETAQDIVRQLKEREITSLDAMILTHYDRDHVGGAVRIAQELPVEQFYLPDYIGEKDKCGELLEMIEEEGLPSVRVSQDQRLSLGDSLIFVNAGLIPYDPEEKNDNDASLFVEVFDGEDSWLFAGDMEEEALQVWLAERAGEYDVLKVPHHGKKEDSSADLIRETSPQIAVITDSIEKEASGKVQKKLEKAGAEIYRSSVDGTITVTGNGKGNYQVITQKN